MAVSETLKAVLFDLDGTLVNSREVDNLVFAELMWDYLQLKVPADTLSHYSGTPTPIILENFAPRERVGELLDAWMTYKTRLQGKLGPYPGVRAMLEALRSAGLRMAVVTSQSDAECALTRQCLGLDELLEFWITSDQVTATKPDPAPVQMALERMGVRPEEAIMIGDTFNDMESGRRAGASIGAVLWGFGEHETLLSYRPDFVFREVQEICALTRLVGTNN